MGTVDSYVGRAVPYPVFRGPDTVPGVCAHSILVSKWGLSLLFYTRETVPEVKVHNLK